VSEAMPGSTNLYAPYAPLPKYWYAILAAAVLWVLTVVGAVLDITDRFPRGVVYTVGTGAGSVTILAGLLWLSWVTRARYAELEQRIEQHGRDVAALTRLASSAVTNLGALDGRVEQISAQMLTRERAHRETLRRVLANPERHNDAAVGALDRSEYWQVYSDVMSDLGGLGGDGPAPASN
jgi:hypothetical protein